ncbi:MAG: hypothetical protein SGILL_008478, partial [Bacillariaceae sp.]
MFLHLAAGQICGVNPFSETGRTTDLFMPNGNACAAETDCLNNPDCYPFGGTSQFPETCANEMRVIWPNEGNTTIVRFRENPQAGTVFRNRVETYGPPTDWSCIPPSVLDCLGEIGGGDVAVLYGVPAGNDRLIIRSDVSVPQASYQGSVIFPISAYGPDPIQDCIFATDAAVSAFSLTVDRTEEHIVALLLDTAGADITGGMVSLEIVDPTPPPRPPPSTGPDPTPPGNGALAPGMGPNNPIADPADH